MADFRPERILAVLAAHGVEYVMIGGLAAAIHGSELVTTDLDITPSMAADNLERLSDALRALHARIRSSDVPDGLPFSHDGRSLAAAGTWNLVTDAGDLDLAFGPAGTTGFDDLARDAVAIEILGAPTVVATCSPEGRTRLASVPPGRPPTRDDGPLPPRTHSGPRARARRGPRRGGSHGDGVPEHARARMRPLLMPRALPDERRVPTAAVQMSDRPTAPPPGRATQMSVGSPDELARAASIALPAQASPRLESVSDRLWTAEELDRLSPNERHQIVMDSMVDDLSLLPEQVRERLRARGIALLRERGLIEC